MKRITTTLLAFLLAFSVITITPLNALETELNVEQVSLTPEQRAALGMKHPQLSVGNTNELSGYLTKDELEAALDPETPVRIG